MKGNGQHMDRKSVLQIKKYSTFTIQPIQAALRADTIIILIRCQAALAAIDLSIVH